MELEFMEHEFHKKRHYRPLWNATIGKTLKKKWKKNEKEKSSMKLEFMELKFHKKRHYRAHYGAIKLKKTCMF